MVGGGVVHSNSSLSQVPAVAHVEHVVRRHHQHFRFRLRGGVPVRARAKRARRGDCFVLGPVASAASKGGRGDCFVLGPVASAASKGGWVLRPVTSAAPECVLSHPPLARLGTRTEAAPTRARGTSWRSTFSSASTTTATRWRTGGGRRRGTGRGSSIRTSTSSCAPTRCSGATTCAPGPRCPSTSPSAGTPARAPGRARTRSARGGASSSSRRRRRSGRGGGGWGAGRGGRRRPGGRAARYEGRELGGGAKA